MGRLIEVDVDKLKELLNDNRIELTNNIISIVREDYIPKADYENRLNADLVAILDKIRAEIAEYGSIMVTYAITDDTRTDKGIEKLVSDVLQQAKEEVLQIIDKHKAESEDK